MAISELDERLPVWQALSEFFLDTELQQQDYEHIAQVLSQSGYSVQELEDILYYEVYPACKWNLLNVAGEWAGFDADWIMTEIAPKKDKRSRLRIAPIHRWMFRHDWKQVLQCLETRKRKVI